MKNIITIDDLSREDINDLLEVAEKFENEEKKGNRYSKELENKLLGPFFAQESTRTKGSFIVAMKELGGSIYSFHANSSAIKKNESVLYTVQMFHAHHVDAINMRHPFDGSVQWAADVSKLPIINGGDGKNWHPTQSLLDLYTFKSLVGRLDNIKVGFSGDLKYGRTVHSLPFALSKYDNVELHLGSPEILMMPDHIINDIESRGVKIFIHENIVDLLNSTDIHYHTRPQFNLMKDDPKAPDEGTIKSELHNWKITGKIINQLKNTPFIMHPLPIDSTVSEIDIEVAFSPKQKYLKQAENGTFVRKAILVNLLQGKPYIPFDGDISHLERFYGQNIIDRSFDSSRTDNNLKPGDIKPISNGYVIDRLKPYSDQDIVDKLGLRYKDVMTSTKHTKSENGVTKSILFIHDHFLTDKEMKTIARTSPDATYNEIRDGKIIRKFVYPTCMNDNCISNYVNEDVPTRFELSKTDKVECHYCRTPHDYNITKLSEQDKIRNIKNLESRV